MGALYAGGVMVTSTLTLLYVLNACIFLGANGIILTRWARYKRLRQSEAFQLIIFTILSLSYIAQALSLSSIGLVILIANLLIAVIGFGYISYVFGKEGIFPFKGVSNFISKIFKYVKKLTKLKD